MQTAPIPSNECDRLAALHRFDVMDSSAEKPYDDLTRLAARICGAEVSVVSLLDEERQWFKSRFGIDAAETPRDISFCGHAIHQSEIMEIPDTLEDPRFADNPLVVGEPRIRFYAGAPLVTAEGHALGTLCVIDPHPKRLNEMQRDTLQTLARQVVKLLELRRQAGEAERANQAKSEFLSRISHELRTPLNGILGFAQLLEAADLPERQMRSAQRINKAGRHLLGLINEVLDLARVEAGELATSLEPVNLREAVREVADLLRPQADERDIDIEVMNAGPDRLIMADRQRIKQVLLNLGSNGIKYNHAGGRLQFGWESSGGGAVRVNVRDTGPGISDDLLQRIFIPFERAGAERTETEGVGLGLALTQRLMEAMNGRVGVESREGEGSCFWFELPEANRERIPPDDTTFTYLSDRSEADQRPVTVLYLEDNLENVRLIEEVLALRPHVQLVTAMQASVGLQLALDRQPEVIFLDLHLPDENGDKVLGKLKADFRTRDIPVIMLTADATHRQQERLLAAGAQEYVTKPIEVQRILNILDALPTKGRNGS